MQGQLEQILEYAGSTQTDIRVCKVNRTDISCVLKGIPSDISTIFCQTPYTMPLSGEQRKQKTLNLFLSRLNYASSIEKWEIG